LVNFRLNPALVVGLVLVLCAGIILGFALLRARRAVTVEDLAAYLPAEQGVVLAIDFASLRQSGLLAALGGSSVAQEPEYTSFVQSTGFDYQEDLDYALAWFRKGTTCILLRGRFDWSRLKDYAAGQQGVCRNSFCRVEGATPERRISFFPLTRGTMALAVGPDEWAATVLMEKKPVRLGMAVPRQPVWLSVPAPAFEDTESLPAGSRLFAKAMQGAEAVTLSLATTEGRMAIELDASCRSAEEASTLSFQLDGVTRILKDMIAREGKSPNPGDLSGVLAAGVFNRVDRRVLGRWPVAREFLESILGVSQ
jgi:hypothetical protein